MKPSHSLSLAAPSLLVITGVGALLSLLALIFYVDLILDPTGKYGVMSLQLAFQREEGIRILEIWGQAGRSHFLHTIWIDFFYPLFYSLFFSGLALRLTAKGGDSALRKGYVRNPGKLLVLLPFGIALLDMAENFLEIGFVLSYPGFAYYSSELFYSHSIVALGKWILAVVEIVSLLFLFLFQRFLRPAAKRK